MLVKMNETLIKARKEDYGIITVSYFSLELIKVTIPATEKRYSPVILNIDLKYNFVREEQDVELSLYMARQRVMRSVISVAISLSHGQNYQTVMRTISHGFTSVAADTSSKPYEENVAVTKEVVHAAHGIRLPVETELDCVGMADETFVLGNKYTKSTKTDPAIIKGFVEKIDTDFLTISVGNTHGPHAKNITPHIDFDLSEEVTVVTPIPPVLHGSSGTGNESLSKAYKTGVSKINISTDLIKAAIREAG